MKAKKFLALLLSLTSVTGSVLSATACGDDVVKDGKTINVMMCEAGYGTAWFEKVAEAYEEVFAEEGYKVNLVDAMNTFTGATALAEMRLDYEDNGVDLFITAGVYVDDVLDLNGEDYGVCVEDLNGVYSKPAIGFDGVEEEVAIKDLNGTQKFKKYLVNPESPDDYYRFQYFAAPTGLAVNERVLKEYGFNTLPYTTDEMFEMYSAIFNGANGKGASDVEKIYPVTWAGGGAPGYPYNGFLSNLASLLGHDGYEDFFTLDHLDNEAGYAADAGAKYYESIKNELIDCYEVFAKTNDLRYSYPGSQGQDDHGISHSQVVQGKAAFMEDGSYFYNETKTHFAPELQDMRFIHKPTPSYLGVKLKLDGTGNDAAKCDEILSFLCKTYDEMTADTEANEKAALKAAAQAQFPGITFTDEQINAVWEARGTVAMNLQSDVYICKDSPVKEQAELFLRMLASKDAAEMQQEYCMPHTYQPLEAKDHAYQWVTDSNKLGTRINYVLFYSFQEGMRVEMNCPIVKQGLIITDLSATQKWVEDITTRDYKAVATKFYQDTYDNLATNWTSLLKSAGRVK
jgi:hypothetical protein